jgi:hypothetical protein
MMEAAQRELETTNAGSVTVLMDNYCTTTHFKIKALQPERCGASSEPPAAYRGQWYIDVHI